MQVPVYMLKGPHRNYYYPLRTSNACQSNQMLVARLALSMRKARFVPGEERL